VLLRVQPNHEGRDVDELLSDTDVTVSDHDTCVVDRLGEAKLEHLCLETTFEEVFGLKVKDVVKLHLVFLQDAVSDETPEECIAFEEPLWVLLVEGKQFTGSLSHLGETVLDSPDLSLATEAVLANHLKLLVESFLFVWSTWGLVGLGAGVGYGVGTWAVDKLKEKRCQNAMDKLHPALKTSLHQWQTYLADRTHGKQATSFEAEMVFAEFAQEQPSNAQLVSDFVRSHGGSTTGGSTATAAPGGNASTVGTQLRSGGVTVVPVCSSEV